MAFGEFLQETAVKLGPILHPEPGSVSRMGTFLHAHLHLSCAVYWTRSLVPSLSLDCGGGKMSQTLRLRGSLIRECAPPNPPWPASVGWLFRHSTNKECA